jgi:hypothetical protein
MPLICKTKPYEEMDAHEREAADRPIGGPYCVATFPLETTGDPSDPETAFTQCTLAPGHLGDHVSAGARHLWARWPQEG